jgi:hypothetical protein
MKKLLQMRGKDKVRKAREDLVVQNSQIEL